MEASSLLKVRPDHHIHQESHTLCCLQGRKQYYQFSASQKSFCTRLVHKNHLSVSISLYTVTLYVMYECATDLNESTADGLWRIVITCGTEVIVKEFDLTTGG